MFLILASVFTKTALLQLNLYGLFEFLAITSFVYHTNYELFKTIKTCSLSSYT